MTTLREHLEASGQPEFLALYERIYPRTYDELVARIYADLDACIGQMEADAKDFMSAHEDVMNRALVRLLQRSGHQASHDHDEGGHVDIRIASRDGKYSWLAEAKILRDTGYLDAGMDQLLNRYTRGTPGHNKGGFVVYVQADRAAERFSRWRQHHEGQGTKYEALESRSCSERPGLAFFSSFVLPRLGAGVPKHEIRHLAVSLYRNDPRPAKEAKSKTITGAKPRNRSRPAKNL
jgi:hypothetical protein